MTWPTPILDDGEIVLRPMTAADAPAVAATCGAGEQGCWSERRPPYGEAEAAMILLEWEHGRQAGGRLALAIVVARSSVEVGGPHRGFLGSLVAMLGSPERPHDAAVRDTLELAYWLRPAARGRGTAPRAVGLFATWVFNELGVQLLWIETDPANTPSRRVAEKAGFAFTGVLAGHCRRGGRPADCAIYELSSPRLEQSPA
jgi:RimJ/RimL family protein N-acetyltransferase